MNQLAGWLAIATLVLFYFAPTVVAWIRGKRSKWAIAVLNTFAGWTIVGWIAALVWACMSDR